MRQEEHRPLPVNFDGSEQGKVLQPCHGEPNVDINLCSGVGGLALGLARAGFRSFDFFDKDQSACATLRHNIAGGWSLVTGRVFEGDLSLTEWLTGAESVRLLAAGIPCQPFSMGGARRGHDDDRNLFPALVKAIRTLKPHAVLIENVRGLERGSHKPYLAYLLRQLRFPDLTPRGGETWTDHDKRLARHELCGSALASYRVVWKVLNSADFGVAQIRHRLFIVATSPGLPAYEFPEPTHSKESLIWEQSTGDYWEHRNLSVQTHAARIQSSRNGQLAMRPWVTVRDAISDLPQAHPQESGATSNHWEIPGARIYPGHTGSSLDWPSKTIKAGTHGVPGGENTVVCDNGVARYYTLREMARVQAFPDEHYFVGSRSKVIRQIGNAVPPALAAAVAAPLGKVLCSSDFSSKAGVESQGSLIPGQSKNPTSTYGGRLVG